MLKKTTIAVLGLAASGLANAGTMGPVCVPGNVTVPCEASKWELGADALYLRSLYGAEKTYQYQFSPQVGTIYIKDVGNSWDWGYRLEGSYYFSTGNDVTVNWTHFHSNANHANIIAFLPLSPVAIPSLFKNSDHFDQVNVVMGQHVDFSMKNKMRIYAGMQYANIQSMAQTYITNPEVVALTTSPLNIFNNTDYKGFGPTLGVNYTYDLYNGLSIVANGAGSLLYGTARYHEGIVVSNFGLIEAQAYARKKAIVPSLEAKLGLNYTYNFAQGMIVNLDAGYQVINYFNVLSTQQFQILAAPNVASVNYGLFGPYFGMRLIGDV
ncbi:MAG: Lpg1974 family pore-forming outer membrane protein [Legionella sp.]|uniref:Lpg1974 family pore-forming outer membrane protein n=1 Tax=Legionella sp. TaxID=459 RepID=UPI0039E44587